jgi:hypothetical protein
VDPILSISIQQLATQAVGVAYRHGLHPYRIPAAAASLLLLLASLLGRDPKPGEAAGRLRRSDLLYLVALALFLFALRWPVLALGDLEGDESVAVSAALTRYLEPGYGVTLFTGSAGPLLTYPLSAIGWLGLRIDYGASKLMSLLLLTASASILYLALRTFSPPRIARVAMLPLLLFVGLGNVRWTFSYCSEQWINLLVVLMIWLLLRLDHRIGRESANLAGLGFALGLIPLIKWQGLPMAALVAGCALALLWARHRAERGRLARSLLLPAGLALAPLLVWCAALWTRGSLGYFFETYFSALFTQATSRYSTTLPERLLALADWGLPAFSIERWFLCFTGLFWIPAAIELFRSGRPPRVRLELSLAIAYLAISLYAVLQPGGMFTHYLNLLVPPYALLSMLVFCRWAEAASRPWRAVALYAALAAALPAILYLGDKPLPVRFPPQETRAKSVDALRELQVAGSPMIQWGWVYAYYVHTGTSWGTRTGGSHEILEPFFPDKRIYVADFVASLDSGRAPVFLDTATEGAPIYAIRAQYGHEQVPEVAEAVRRNYFLCAEFQGARLFLQRKRYQSDPKIQAWCERHPRWQPPRKT